MQQSAHKMFVNTVLLTSASLVMRGVGLVFQVYLASKIGASSIGVYSLIMSVYTMFVTLGSGGIRFAVTRLTAAAVTTGGCVRKTVRTALVYALCLGTASAALMLGGANFIGERWISVPASAAALRILSPSLPFICVTSVFGGYFTGVERVVRSVAVNIIEQLSRIAVTVILLGRGGGLGYICGALAAAAVFGEAVSCAAHSVLYAIDIRRFPKTAPKGGYIGKMFSTAMPIAVSAYMRTGLSSLGHILIPRGLRAAGANFERSFAAYGTIHGMVFPVLLFPSALLTSLAELIIPRLTAAQASGGRRGINYMATRVFKLGLTFSAGVAGIIFFFGGALGSVIYKTDDVGMYMRYFAPLIPIMYCDMITDGCLKGLGQHMKAMYINLAEAVLNVILLYLLIPRLAVLGYAISIYVCEGFNFALSFGRLLKVAQIGLSPGDVFGILLAAAGAGFAAALLPFWAAIFADIVLYVLFLYALGIIARSDLAWLRRNVLCLL